MSRNLILARYIYTKSIKNRAHPFCKCSQADAERCVCGENDSRTIQWKWYIDDSTEVSNLVIDGLNVIFHPIFSQGTAAVRGNKSLDKQMIHYWEIKILSNMTGTDLMIGIGTDKVDLVTSCQYKYSSLLCLDNQSWGYSYRGLAQHNGRLKYYGKRFSSLCIVGVYLDLRRRCIEFYLNRRPQGVAYRHLKFDDNADVYPMVCSTSAKSSVKLINATSFVENLQYLCIKVISKDQKSVEFVKSAPGLRHLCTDYWFLFSKERYQYFEVDDSKKSPSLEDEALLCCLDDRDDHNNADKNDSADEMSITDEMDIYNGVDYIKHRKPNLYKCTGEEDDDEDVDMEFFCDHF